MIQIIKFFSAKKRYIKSYENKWKKQTARLITEHFQEGLIKLWKDGKINLLIDK
jgi:hypothetical protein